MAHFGDTRGRKRMFTLSVLLMAIPTLLIGLLPTYQSTGRALASPVNAGLAGRSHRRRGARCLGLRCRACETRKGWFRIRLSRIAHRGYDLAGCRTDLSVPV